MYDGSPDILIPFVDSLGLLAGKLDTLLLTTDRVMILIISLDSLPN